MKMKWDWWRQNSDVLTTIIFLGFWGTLAFGWKGSYETASVSMSLGQLVSVSLGQLVSLSVVQCVIRSVGYNVSMSVCQSVKNWRIQIFPKNSHFGEKVQKFLCHWYFWLLPKKLIHWCGLFTLKMVHTFSLWFCEN